MKLNESIPNIHEYNKTHSVFFKICLVPCASSASFDDGEAHCRVYDPWLSRIYVTRPAKIDHVGTFRYLRNTNLKYLMLHNSPMPDSSHVRFILEVQQGNSY